MRFITRCEGQELRYSTLRLACRDLDAPPSMNASVEIELEGRGIFYKNGPGFLKNQIQLFDGNDLFSWTACPNLIPCLFENNSDFDRRVYQQNKYLTKIIVEQTGTYNLLNITKLFYSKVVYNMPLHFVLRTNLNTPASYFSPRQKKVITDNWQQEGF